MRASTLIVFGTSFAAAAASVVVDVVRGPPVVAALLVALGAGMFFALTIFEISPWLDRRRVRHRKGGQAYWTQDGAIGFTIDSAELSEGEHRIRFEP